MALTGKHKAAKGRWNIVVMRSKGRVTTFSISPALLVAALVFALAFSAASIVVMNRYFEVYPAHRDLLAAHQEASRELARLQHLYAYQYAVADDYANLMKAVGQSDLGDGTGPAETNDAFIPLGALDDPSGTAVTAPNAPVDDPADQALAAWAARFPDPASPPEQELDVEQLEVDGATFKLRLFNRGLGRQVQGNLLMLFAVRDGERVILRPYPDFDPDSTDPDFSRGPAYNIRSSKPIGGRLNLPEGAVVREVMVVVRSRAGEVVLKKKLTLPRP